MQTFNDKIDDLNAALKEVKTRVKDKGLEVEALRARRSELDSAVTRNEAGKSGIRHDDARLAPLYDWYAITRSSYRCSLTSLKVHRISHYPPLTTRPRAIPRRLG